MNVPGIAVERAIAVPMRDGCRLAADIYRPTTAEARLPVLVHRTPYGRQFPTQANMAHPAWYARHGFIVVVQDVRGRHDSDGAFEPFFHEAADGYDTIQWASELAGSSGKVGTYGASYGGYAQLLAAAANPPALRVMCPAITPFDARDDMLFSDGVFELSFGAWWAASLALESARRSGDRDLDREIRVALAAIPSWYGSRSPSELLPAGPETAFYRTWLEHRSDDAWWEPISARARVGEIRVPALFVTGWWDPFLDGALAAFRALSAQESSAASSLLVGPWSHVPWGARVGDVGFGPAADQKVADAAQVDFLGRFLRNGDVSDPGYRVRYFLPGRNTWISADQWPPTDGRTMTWRLGSDGDAASIGGSGRLVAGDGPLIGQVDPDWFSYDASGPAPGLGGRSCCFPETSPVGPRDQDSVEVRRDVLVYSSPPLDRELLIEGPIDVALWLASDAVTADIVARLCQVDGRRSVNIAEGVTRVSMGEWPLNGYRRVIVALGETATVVPAGAALRLQVTGGAFPRFEINPQVDIPPARAAPSDRVAASFALAHDDAHVSVVRVRATAS